MRHGGILLSVLGSAVPETRLCMVTGTASGALGSELGISVAVVHQEDLHGEGRAQEWHCGVPRFGFAHRCSFTQVCICIGVSMSVPSLEGREELVHPCPMCARVCALLLSQTIGVGHTPAVLAALFPHVHASCEGVGVSRGVHCCWQPLGCSCPAQPGWGVPPWGRHFFTSGCGRGSWLSPACQCPGGDWPAGLCGHLRG